MEKKKFTWLYRIIMLVLAGVLTIMSLFTVVNINLDLTAIEEDPDLGAFLNDNEAPSEVSLRFGVIPTVQFVSPLIRHSNDFGILFDAIGEAMADEDANDPDDEVLEAVARIMEDEKCAQSIYIFYGVTCSLADSMQSMVNLDFELGTGIVSVIMGTLGVITIIGLIILAVVYPFILVVKYIIFLVRSLKHINDEQVEDADAATDRFPIGSYSVVLLAFYALSTVFFNNISMGAAIPGVLTIYALVYLLRSLKLVLFAEKDRKQILIKQAITLITIIAVIVLLCNFSLPDIMHEYEDNMADMSLTRYAEKLKELGTNKTNEAKHSVTVTNAIYGTAIAAFTYFGVLILTAVLNSGIERCAGKKARLRTSEQIPHPSMMKTAIFLLVLALIPVFISTNSAEAREAAYKAGHFKIWYTEYREEGTRENLEYMLYTEYVDEGIEEVAHLKEQLKDASEEDAEDISERITDAEQNIKAAQQKIREIEALTRRATITIVASLLLMLAEIAFFAVQKHYDNEKKALPRHEEVHTETVRLPEESPIEEQTSTNDESMAE